MDRSSGSSGGGRKDSSSTAKTGGLFVVIPCGFGVSCRDYFHYLSGLHGGGGAQRDRRVEGRELLRLA